MSSKTIKEKTGGGDFQISVYRKEKRESRTRHHELFHLEKGGGTSASGGSNYEVLGGKRNSEMVGAVERRGKFSNRGERNRAATGESCLELLVAETRIKNSHNKRGKVEKKLFESE